MQDFKKLKIWQEGLELTIMIYKVTKAFPKEEMYGMISQLRRASASITANIAEGCGKRTTKEFRAFVHIANGSCKEVESFIILAKRIGYLDDNSFEELNTKIAMLQKMIISFIKVLNERIRKEGQALRAISEPIFVSQRKEKIDVQTHTGA